MKEAMIAAGLGEPIFAADAFFRATFLRLPEFALKRDKKERFKEKLEDGSEELEEKLGEKFGEAVPVITSNQWAHIPESWCQNVHRAEAYNQKWVDRE